VFSPNGDILAAALFEGSVRLWNADGSERATIADAHGVMKVRALAFSPRGDVVASVGLDGTLRRWKPDGTPAGPPSNVHEGSVFSVAYSPRADWLATTSYDNVVRIWNRDGAEAFTLPHDRPSGVAGIALATQAALLAAADDRGGVRLWNLDGTPHGAPVSGQQQHPGALALSATSELLATGANDATVRMWDFSGAPHGQPMQTDGGQVAALAFSPSGELLAVGTAAFQLWKDGQRLWQHTIFAADYVQAIAFAPRGDFMVTGSWLGWIEVWNPDGSVRAVRPKHGIEFTTAVAVAPDGQYLAAALGGSDSVVQVFNLDLSTRGEPLVNGEDGEVPTLTFSPDGHLVTGGADGLVRIWTLPSRQVESFEIGRPINQLGYWHNLLWVRAADDPTFLQDATEPGGTILFYDPRHTLVATMIVRPDAALAFTPDGWFSATDWPADGLRLYRASGDALSAREMEHHRSPQRVLDSLTKAAG
jgi:WD40 repeat protein